MEGDHDLIVCFARHKCASSWQTQILLDVSRELGLQFGYVHNEESFGHDIGKYVGQRGIETLVFGNAQNSYLSSGLPEYRGFHIVRDPRDQLVSAYFSHKNSHEPQGWLEEHRSALRSVDERTGLHLEMDFFIMEFILDQIRHWNYDNPRVLELRFEDVTARPEVGLKDAFDFVGLFERGLTEDRFFELLAKHSFAGKSGGREPGQSDEHSHYRRGIAGDWRNHFLPEHVDHFKEKYNDILVRLGYETGTDWRL